MQNNSENARTRLKAMVQHTSGFKLSEIDLELRGPGHIYGLRQSGIPDLKMASLSDSVTINKARISANNIINDDPELKKYEILSQKIAQLHSQNIKD